MISRFRQQSLPALRAPFFLPAVFALLTVLVSCAPSPAQAFVIPDTTNWRIPMRPVGPDLVSDMVQDGIDTPQIIGPVLVDIELNWTVPTLRVDGSALAVNEISGYVINQNGTEISVPGGTTISYVATALLPGTYVFSIATVDTNGQRGPFSSPITVIAN